MAFLEQYKITAKNLLELSFECEVSESSIKNGLVLDLFYFARDNNLQLNTFLCPSLAALCKIDINQINSAASLSRIHRLINLLKTKRGNEKEKILNGVFTIPQESVTVTQNKCKTKNVVMVKDDSLLNKLHEKQDKVRKLSELQKQTKRKLERAVNRDELRKEKIQKLNDEAKLLKQTIKKVNVHNTSIKATVQTYKDRNRNNLITITNLRRTVKELKALNEAKDNQINKLQNLIEENKNACEQASKVLKETKDNVLRIDYLESLLEDKSLVNTFDEVSNRYTPELVNCVMNLNDLKVPNEKVGKVINEVLKLGGKVPNAVPSSSTVSRMIDAKLAAAHKHISKVLPEKSNTTLYTDETRKYGRTYQTYVVTDETKSSYILGLREMADKSSQSTLDTFKDILNDVSDYCYQKEQNQNAGYKILSNIKNTMSDRASTEKAFNNLLEKYRSNLLPDIMDGWNEMTEEEKGLCSHVNNFFCGLHLLVGMADTCEAALKKFEGNYLNGESVGSSADPYLRNFQKNESGSLRLIRTCCKAFAPGQDEKNGVSLQFNLFLKGRQNKNHIVRFKHNRFNLVFALGNAVFYHHEDISEFLDTVHGSDNTLLKAVSLDIKEQVFLSGTKALALISKLITGPLWRLLEGPGHIMNMNHYYKQLSDFLQKASVDIETVTKFIKGEVTPFDSVIDNNEPLTKCLLTDEVNDILVPMLQNLLLAMSEMLNRMVVDHLPQGVHWNPTNEKLLCTSSVMKHNKLPEFVFGQLDQLFKYRPNATLVTNEAFLMYSHNKTRIWLDTLEESHRNSLILECQKEGKQIRKQFKVRLQEIEAKRLEAQEKRRQHLLQTERKRLQNAENFTNMVCFYGLWQSAEQIKEGLNRLTSEKEKRDALESQIRFRKNVLKQKHTNKKIFNFSYKNANEKYVKLTLKQLESNVKALIEDTLGEETVETKSHGVPLLVGKSVKHQFKEGESNLKAYKGKVISVVPGFPNWYNIKYEEDEAIYAFNLVQDYKNGDLQLVVES